MISFKQFLRYLFEALSEDDFYVKRGLQSIPRNVYDKIIKTDPTYKQGQVGDLSFQVLQWYKKDPNKNDFMANLDTTFHNLEFYTKNSKNNPRFKSVLQQNNIKGVQDFKTTKDLNNLMNQYYQNKEEGQQSDIKTTLNKIPKNEYEILYEDNEWLVADIYTHNASIIFGKELCKGGPWCTTSRENRYHFDQYIAVGDLYFFLNKKDTKKTHYYSPINNEFANYSNQNAFSTLNNFKQENPNLDNAFNIIDAEINKQKTDINYLLEKRFEKFKMSPSIEGLLLPLSGNHVLKEKDVMKWFIVAQQNGINFNQKPIVGHQEDRNNQIQKVEGDQIILLVAHHNYPNIIKFLLSHGADPNAKDNYGKTPLHFASREGNKEIVELLLKHGVDPQIKNNEGNTPLYFASRNKDKETVELLLNHGADPNVKNRVGEPPLIVVSVNGHKEIVELLLKHGADPNVKDDYGDTPLYFASSWGHKETVELLLNHGADPNVENENDGHIPLYSASSEGHKETVELLLKYGADPNVKNKYGETPLSLASSKGYKEIIELLLKHGADPNTNNDYGNAPLHFASREGNKEIVELLLNHGADPNIRGRMGYTALIGASRDGNKEIVELLKQYGAKE